MQNENKEMSPISKVLRIPIGTSFPTEYINEKRLRKMHKKDLRVLIDIMVAFRDKTESLSVDTEKCCAEDHSNGLFGSPLYMSQTCRSEIHRAAKNATKYELCVAAQNILCLNIDRALSAAWIKEHPKDYHDILSDRVTEILNEKPDDNASTDSVENPSIPPGETSCKGHTCPLAALD